MSTSVEPINFPCLIALKFGLLALDRSEARSLLNLRHVSGNTFLLSRASSPAFRLEFLIDRFGRLRRCKPMKVRRDWLHYFAPIADLTMMEVELTPGEGMTAGELVKVLQKGASTWDGHVSRHAKLIRALRQTPQDQGFGQSEFESAWEQCAMPLPAAKWSETIPETTRA